MVHTLNHLSGKGSKQERYIVKMDNKIITVTSPLLPNLDEFQEYLRDIWNKKWLTNNGTYHQQLEKALADYLKVPYVCLFTNGTLPLLCALQALRITGEVITTPYSFVATTHTLWWNNIKPVFVDIEPVTCNIDPDKIEAAITPQTTAIMPVHVYGKPCDTERIQKIADKYGLKVIYDAAHAFGVEVNGKSILEAGDISTLSFHATKVYNTIEGGALVCHDEKTKQRINYLLNLKQVDTAIAARQQIANEYRRALHDVKGITFMDDIPGVRHNYSYFPIFINKEKYGMTRDELYFKMKEQGVWGRRYFYPLISEFSTYRGLESSRPEKLLNAHKMADTVICLPMHHILTKCEMSKVIESIID